MPLTEPGRSFTPTAVIDAEADIAPDAKPWGQKKIRGSIRRARYADRAGCVDRVRTPPALCRPMVLVPITTFSSMGARSPPGDKEPANTRATRGNRPRGEEEGVKKRGKAGGME